MPKYSGFNKYKPVWTLSHEREFISGLGSWNSKSGVAPRKKALEGYIKSLDLPDRRWTDTERERLRKWAMACLGA